MKKISIFMMSLIIAAVITGCGSDPSVKTVETKQQERETIAEETIPEDAIENREQMTFEPMMVVDNDACSIEITEIEPDTQWGYGIDLRCVNKSQDSSYMLTVRDAVVNGVQINPSFVEELEPNSESVRKLYFNADAMKKQGLKRFTDIELNFLAYNSNDWEADYLVNDSIRFYPYGEEETYTFERKGSDEDDPLIDNESLTIIRLNGGKQNKGFGIPFYIQNKTDHRMLVKADHVKINGKDLDPHFECELMSGTSTFSGMGWSKKLLDKEKIKEIKDVEFTLRAYDYDDLSAEYYIDEQFNLKFE